MVGGVDFVAIAKMIPMDLECYSVEAFVILVVIACATIGLG